MIGNQVDLLDNEEREVTSDEGKAFAEKLGLAGFIETSAKSGYNVEQAFTQFSSVLFDRWRSKTSYEPTVAMTKFEIKATAPVKKKKKCCN